MPAPANIKTLVLPSESGGEEIDFDSIKLKLASPEQITNEWSHGEVSKPETINYRSQKPEMGGLFCQRIFGPVKDFECACGKYKKVRYKGMTCDRCGVEITRSIVRRQRMGHIKLAAPVTHIWFLRGMRSKIGTILGMSVKDLEKITYFANFVITEVHEERKEQALKELEDEFLEKKKQLEKEDRKKDLKDLKERYKKTKKEIANLQKKVLISEIEYRDLSLKYGHIFDAKIGAEAVLKLLQDIDLPVLVEQLETAKEKTNSSSKKKKLIRQIKLARSFIKNKMRPEWMVLQVIPVIPPDLRPLIQLDGGRFASSDLNDLYRRVINRNNRLKRLYELRAPEVILRNEKRMLQEAVDTLLDNQKRSGSKTTMASTGQQRLLKSLADMLRGKQGRFRRNLLGKRVDYSGRSVIVVGPHLKLDQCGLPKLMARELFKPFIASKLIQREIVHNVRTANRLIDEGTEEVWEILEEVVKDSYVLLNRAPTLHRLSIQAFKPVLIEGKAIKIHPLVCPAFNADFDGDQMAVHVPITKQARKEAEEIMLSTNNLLKPATGNPIVHLRHEMVWGAYWMTIIEEKEKPKIFRDKEEAIFAYQAGKIGLREKILLRTEEGRIETSAGRTIFQSILPKGYYSMDKVVDNQVLKEIVVNLVENETQKKTVSLLDEIKEITLSYLTTSGLSWGMDDIQVPEGKQEIVKEAEQEIEKIQTQYKDGLLTEDERYKKSIQVWMEAKDRIGKKCKEKFSPYNPVISMLLSGARGSWSQLSQMVGMRGIVSSPTGKLIELPIKSSFKEGFDVLEYFISSHGSRKGNVDKALRTASAGYLTRRLVDVAQSIKISEEDCKDKEGLKITREECQKTGKSWADKLRGRVAAQDIKDSKGKVLVKQGEIIDRQKALAVEEADPEEVQIRSVLTCKTRRGICAKCYGWDLAYNQPVKLGTAVGVIAAQAIGEPGTQLTMRTFHTGGVAGKDITQGLPRVEQMFEVRHPKKEAFLAPAEGQVEVIDDDDRKEVKIKYTKKKKESYKIPPDYKIVVKEGDEIKKDAVLAKPKNDSKKKRLIKAKRPGKITVTGNKIDILYTAKKQKTFDARGYSIWAKDKEEVTKGQQLTDGTPELLDLYRLRGEQETARYILKEILHVYSSQGQGLDDKHIEIIVRQMFSRMKIVDGGDTDLLAGAVVPEYQLEEENEKTKKAGGKPARAKRRLLGISKVSLSTDSWLSSASFQETSRILIDAAVNGQVDYLRGLKENVIVGRLVPVGTGYQPKHKKKK